MQTAYTLWNEAGGTGRSTFAINLGVAHARHGYDVLLVDLDHQESGITHQLGLEDRKHADVPHIGQNLVGMESAAPPTEYIKTIPHEGIDVIPSHDRMLFVEPALVTMGDQEGEVTASRLASVLLNDDIPSEYDILIIEPPSTAGGLVENALYATEHLLIPAPFSTRGRRSIEGMQGLLSHYQQKLDQPFSIFGVLPNKVEDTNLDSEIRESMEQQGFPVLPVEIRKRKSLFTSAEKHQISAFTFYEEHRSGTRDYEEQTLERLDELACYIEDKAGIS